MRFNFITIIPLSFYAYAALSLLAAWWLGLPGFVLVVVFCVAFAVLS